jgi:hypothetical protein
MTKISPPQPEGELGLEFRLKLSAVRLRDAVAWLSPFVVLAGVHLTYPQQSLPPDLDPVVLPGVHNTEQGENGVVP